MNYNNNNNDKIYINKLIYKLRFDNMIIIIYYNRIKLKKNLIKIIKIK